MGATVSETFPRLHRDVAMAAIVEVDSSLVVAVGLLIHCGVNVSGFIIIGLFSTRNNISALTYARKDKCYFLPELIQRSFSLI